MLHGVFRGEKRRSQIVNPVFHLDLQVRIGEHGLNEIAFHVRRSGEAEVFAAAMLPIPIAPRLV